MCRCFSERVSSASTLLALELELEGSCSWIKWTLALAAIPTNRQREEGETSLGLI